ncbi:MAG: DUF371 domain-containing protein [Candidatus Lokiarchaeota archaeon]
MIIEKIYAFGHENITCNHNSTIEITKDNYLTLKGTCILGIKSSKSCQDLNEKTKQYIKAGKKFKVSLISGPFKDTFYGFGHKKLKLTHKNDMVFRKSNYLCNRTVLIRCSKSAQDLNRDLIENIQNKKSKFQIIFELMT